MKRRKNRALKKKVSRLTRRAGRQKIFQLPSMIRKILGYFFILLSISIFFFPIYSLTSLTIGLLFLRGPVYTEKKILRTVHMLRRVKSSILKYTIYLFRDDK